MPLPDLGHFVDSMTIARSDLAQIFSRHAVETIDGLGVLARRDQQIVERRPVVAPVEVEADALLQFFGVNLAPPPFVENVLITRKNCFKTEDYGAVSGLGTLLEKSRGKTLRRRQSVIVADENQVGAAHAGSKFLPVDDGFVRAEGLAEVF